MGQLPFYQNSASHGDDMPLIYIAQASSANGVDLVSTGASLGIQFSATSYRATLNIPVKQFVDNSVLLNTTNTQLPADKWYASPSLFLTLAYASVPSGNKWYAASSSFLSVSPSTTVTYPNKTYTPNDVLIVTKLTKTAQTPVSGSATTDQLINVRATTPVISGNVYKGYATTIVLQNVAKTFVLPMSMYA